MAKATKKRTSGGDELPSTLQRSGEAAQNTYAKTLESAEDQYGEGERAHRTAYAALKHTHEKVGDHWEPKEKNGPSDARAEGGAGSSQDTAGGVDANASKAHLYNLAKKLDVPGRSTMSKGELVRALQKANDASTRRARESGAS